MARVYGLEPKAQRIAADLEELRGHTMPDLPFTRRAFSPLYFKERVWLRRRMEDAGLMTSVDAAGNLIGTRPANRPPRPPVMMGSHTDTVTAGGLYDGTVGVVGALEVARLIREAGLELPFELEVVDFLAEEPSDYGLSCIGSRGMVGHLGPAELARRDPAGRTLAEALRDSGGDPDRLTGPLRRRDDLTAYLELHIEQGPVLEASEPEHRIGVVMKIAGIRRYELEILGEAGHAGTVPMDRRKDAMVGAADAILAINEIASNFAQDGYFVATAGSLRVVPGAANVVPKEARATVEARALGEDLLDRFAERLQYRLDQIGQARRLRVELREQSRSVPVMMDAGLQAIIARTARALGILSMPISSGAGHDAAHLAAICPAGMIFIPCHDGISHSSDERADLEDIVVGTRVLFGTLLALAEGI